MIRLQREMMTPARIREQAGLRWLDVDINESAEDYRFSFEIPGAERDDVRIWVEQNVLSVSGEKKDTGGESRKIHAERAFGKFERSFRLPHDVDGGNIKAEFANGILVVTVPKSEKSKRVDISIN